MEDTAVGAAPRDAPDHSATEDAVPAEAPRLRSPEEAERLVLELIAEHADSLLRVARRYSLCVDDAQDAYQRGLEILMRHAARLDADRAGGWLHTVVKREAMAVNASRRRIVGGEEVDLDSIEVRTAPSPEDRVLAFERVSRTAEALQRLKPQEVRALWLKAMGNSYQEICDATGWTYTKVNRCLAEGRKSFLARYAGIEAGEECERWAPALSAMVDGEATAEQLLELRPHLRNCGPCRATVRELRGSSAPLVALFPAGGMTIAGPGPLETAAQWVAKLWELLCGSVQERAASTAYRAHALAQTLPGGKVAATAASVAAVAGGGIAVDKAVQRPDERPRMALTAPALAPTATTRFAVREVRPAPPPARTTPTTAATKPKRASAAKRHRPARSAPRARPATVSTPPASVIPARAPQPPTPAAGPATAPATPAPSEFDVETR